MPQLPDRQALEAMKRSDLQKLCKDFGVKANLKTENIINLLLDTYDSTSHSEQPVRRETSTRLTSRSSGHGRTSSVIIHDIDDNESDNMLSAAEEDQRVPDPVAEIPQTSRQTRKAKDTQYRLGVGRPVAAGGKGARAVTKSLSVSRSGSRRGKDSRTVRQTEDTIPEEPETERMPEIAEDSQPEAGPSNGVAVSETQPDFSNSQPSSSSTDIDQRIADALQPVYEQLKTLKSDFDQMHSLKNEMSQLRSQVTEAQTWKQTVDSLTAEVKDLRQKAASIESLTAEIAQLKQSVAALPSSSSSSDENMSGFRTPTMTKTSVSPALTALQAKAGPSSLAAPSIAPILLGKRSRDSTSSEMTGVVEESRGDELSDSELAKQVLRPDKKRARLALNPDTPAEDQAGPSTSSLPVNVTSNRLSGFTVFSGPESADDSYVDPPPPTTPLPTFYRGHSPSDSAAGPSQLGGTTSQHAAENQHPFGFTFGPVPPTPGAELFPFPYPEPPQSPTPTGAGNTTITPDRNRSDIFQSFGLPSPERRGGRIRSLQRLPRSTPVALGGAIDPATLTLEGSSTSSLSEEDNPESMVKRTMYGTELEGDTRFGDFGLEGATSKFWPPGRF